MDNLELRVLVAGWSGTTTSIISTWWTSHGLTVLRLACAVMALLAALKLGDEFRRLVWEPGHNGAVDLKLRHAEVHDWFAGKPVYQERPTAVYPPASYALLWPLLGWLPLAPTRWLWAVTSVVALGWLVYLIVQRSGSDSRLEHAFVALTALSMNATGVTIGNGQLGVHLLPVLLGGLLLLQHLGCGWQRNLLASGMIVVALVKPSISLPFLWMVLFAAGGLHIISLVSFGYVALTVCAASFQESGLALLLRDWLALGTTVVVKGGYANLHMWLATIGLEKWVLPASLLVLAALGLWTYRHRNSDFWLLLGVTAIAARLWTYHRVYDDVLILFPMVALFRIAKRRFSTEESGVLAGLLLATTLVAMLAPARLQHFPSPWSLLYTGGHAVIWIAVLGFLLDQARRDRNAQV
ncbi:MAG: DUF2029 domain-containing protein [Anaerolineae bacterium]|nr:DUF2029 domain-containing protein [Anaerolineae bacterium]NIN96948.1 DUF2029 domain-containing protein [Anaerolineae bacterium]NIQ79909.1 DUF2029 domain-containing protein [Anaerolineae bacterium]